MTHVTATPPTQRVLATELPGPKSTTLMARKEAAVSRAVATAMPVFAESATGSLVRDVDGNSLIDLGSGIAVTSVGHAEPRVVAAVRDQLDQLAHTCFMVTPYAPYVEVCEQLNRLTPGSFAKKSALFTSGAEAVENAVKMARRFTGRSAIAVLDHAYHGRTSLTMTMTSKVVPYKDGFGPFVSDVYRVPGSYPLWDGLSGADAAQRTITRLESQIGARHLACVVVEPIQGEGGFIVPADGYLAELVAWCQANDVLFIADEVQTGFARTGDWFASGLFGIEPDIVVTAKGIAGGLPLSGITGRADVMDSAGPGGLGGTFGGNPLGCAAALATIQTYEEDGLLERAREIESRMLAQLQQAQARDPRIAEVRGRGAMIAIELIDAATGQPDAALTRHVAVTARQRGVITLSCGTHDNVLRFLPALNIPFELLDEGLSIVLSALSEAGTPGSLA